MSNIKFILILISLLFISVSSFEIEIINQGAHANPAGIFGTPDNIITDIINDIEKDFEKSQTNFLSKKSKNKMQPHRHKEIIEVNGPGFKSVEIREVFSPEDINKTIKPGRSPLDGLFPSHEKKDKENTLENAIEQMEKEIFQDKKSNPFENMINSLFSPPQHSPVIFVNQRKNLKQSNNHYNDSLDENEKEFAPMPFKIFSGLDNMINNIFKMENSIENQKRLEDEKDKHKTNTVGTKNIDHVNSEDKGRQDKDEEKKKFHDEEMKIKKENRQKVAVGHSKNHVEKDNHSQVISNKNEKNSNNHLVDLKENKSNAAHLTDNKNPNSNYLHNFLPKIKENVGKSIIYLIFIIIVISFVFCIASKIIQRDSEMNKQNKNHSINQIEDELKGMKDKNKLY